MSLVGMRTFMKGPLQYIMLIALAVIFAIGALSFGLGDRQDSVMEDSGVVAVVNGKKLQRAVYERAVEMELSEIEGARLLSPIQESQIRGRVFDDMVDRLILKSAAEKAKIKVSRRDMREKTQEIVEQQISMVREQLLAGLEEEEQTDERFEEELDKVDLSVSKMSKEMTAMINQSRDQLREQIMLEKHMDLVLADVDMSDEAFKASFDEAKYRQITVLAHERTMAQAEQRAKEIVEKLRAGDDFAELAKEHSDDHFSEMGGDRGFFVRRTFLEEEIAAVAFDLELEEISDAIEMQDSYVIVKVEERQSNLPEDFDDPEKHEQYKEAFVSQTRNKALSDFEKYLRQTAVIEIHDPELRAHKILTDFSRSFDPNEADAFFGKIKEAIEEYKKATEEYTGYSQVMARAYAQIGTLYFWMYQPGFFEVTDEEKAEYKVEAREALKNALQYCEANDIRLMLAELLVEDKEFEKAVEHLKIVSENAFDDYQTHRQLYEQYEKMRLLGYAEAAKLMEEEQNWMDAYIARMHEEQERQAQMEAEMVTAPFQVDPEAAAGSD